MRIRVFPDPVLREKAKEIRTSQARDTADALISSMRSSKGCVGVAAPQLGMLSRVAVVDVT
ncbi:MAG TPA: peptide deformylase, partial [Candidatus Goldiibacteriota bacterium]|nr:peptide deformylase [Candidatus Goldiibacteriota bacterium]